MFLAPEITLFDVHRWSRGRDRGHCLKVSKNELVQFSPLVSTLKSCRAECILIGEIHGNGTTRFSIPSDNGLYLSYNII